MMRALILLTLSLPFVVSTASADEQFSFEKKEVQHLAKQIKMIFQARDEDDRAKEIEAREELKALVGKVEEAREGMDILKFTDAWLPVKEGTIDSSNRVFRSTGRGFRNAEYVDMTDVVELPYVYYISLPKEYDVDSEVRFPVILFLHPEITGRGKPDRETNDILKDLYSDAILEKYIVIAPVGPMEGSRRRKELVDAGKDWESLDPGRKTAFVAIKLLLEQMVFDRSRVFIDGMGKAGLSAFRYATWYPSFFAGVIGRDAPLAPLAMENVKGIPFLYLSSKDNENAAAAKKWAEENTQGEVPQVTFQEDSGTLPEPSPEAQTAIVDWLDKIKKNTAPAEIHLKTAELDKAGAYWLRVDELNAGLNMKLDDPEYPWIKAKVDPESNTITLESARIMKVSLFLNDKILDLDKKITVIFNGKNRFEGKVERSLEAMIDLMYYNAAGDFEIYCNSLEITEQN